VTRSMHEFIGALELGHDPITPWGMPAMVGRLI